MDKTMIQIDSETKDRLTKLKIHPRQSYNEIISILVRRAK